MAQITNIAPFINFGIFRCVAFRCAQYDNPEKKVVDSWQPEKPFRKEEYNEDSSEGIY